MLGKVGVPNSAAYAINDGFGLFANIAGAAAVQAGKAAVQGARAITTEATKYLTTKNMNVVSKVEYKGLQINRASSFAGAKQAPLDYAPYQKVRNFSTVINGRKYTGHVLDRMQDRGFFPSVIENALKTGRVSFSRSPGRLKANYYDSVNNLKVVVGENGQVITAIPVSGKK